MRAGRRRRGYWAAVLVVMSFACTASAQHEPSEAALDPAPLIVAQGHAWPPFAYLDSDDEPRAVLIDLWRILGEAPGRPVEFHLVDWPESIERVRDGVAGVGVGNAGLLSSLNEAIASVSDETLRQIEQRWLSGETREVVPARLIPIILGVSLLGLLLVAASLLLLQRRWLRQQIITRTEELRCTNEQLDATLCFMRRVTDNLPGIIFSFRRPAGGSHDSFTYISDRVTEWFDLTPEQLREDAGPLLERIVPEDADAFTRSIDESARALTLWQGQFQVQFGDGHYRWVNAQSMPTRQDDGSTVWYGYFVEVQAYKEMEIALRTRERQFRLIVENANDIIYTVDANGLLTYVSPNWTAMLGHAVNEVQGQPMGAFIHAEDQATFQSALDAVLGTGQRKTDLEFRIRHKNGGWRWHMSNAAPIDDDETGETLYLGIGRDITARRLAEQEQHYQYRFQRLVADLSSRLVDYGFGNVDPQINDILTRIGEFFEVDRAYLFRFSPDQTTMTNTHEWCAPGVSSVIEDMQDVSLDELKWWWQKITGMVDDQEVVFVRDVEALPEEAAVERGILRSQQVRSMFGVPVKINQRVIGFFGVDSTTERHWREDQTDLLRVIANLLSGALEKNRLEQEVMDMSITDPLTGLPNRRFLETRLPESIENYSRYGRDFAVAILDLDHFKRINDTYGHGTGDDALRQFAAIVGNCVRATDVVARYGGEEFVIVFPDTPLADAQRSVERVLEQTRTLTARDERLPVTITVSAGVVMASEIAEDTLSLEALTAVADARLFQAKNRGRDQMV